MIGYIRGMEINGRQLGSFEITTYKLIGGNIMIDKVKALDINGKYIKFAKLDKVLPYLSKYPIKFKPLDNV